VVGRAHDERVEVALRHQRANAVELRVVTGPAHEIVTVSAHLGHGHVRIRSVPSPPREAGMKSPTQGWGYGPRGGRGGAGFSGSYHRTRSGAGSPWAIPPRSEEHTSELQSRGHLVCRLLLEKKKLDDPE